MFKRLKQTSSTSKKSKFRHAFIVTYGRSGSTLLMGLLNEISGWLITGENNNYVYHIFLSIKSARAAQNEFGKTKPKAPTHPWWGIDKLNIAELEKALSIALENSLVSNTNARVLGFKEVRYPKIMEDGNLDEYLYFITKTFPHSVLIFNFRNLDDVMKSKWWARADTTARAKNREMLENFESCCKTYHQRHQDSSYIVKYESLVRDTKEAEKLVRFLGEELSESSITALLNKRHSY